MSKVTEQKLKAMIIQLVEENKTLAVIKDTLSRKVLNFNFSTTGGSNFLEEKVTELVYISTAAPIYACYAIIKYTYYVFIIALSGYLNFHN